MATPDIAGVALGLGIYEASIRTRQSLSELIAGRLSSPDGRTELVKLATRLIVEEAL